MPRDEVYLFWIMGFAGSGKSEVSKLICEELCKDGLNFVWLDGDDLRERLYLDGHTVSDRIKFGKIYLNLCQLFLELRFNVVLSSIGLNAELQKYAKSIIDNYVPIRIDTSIEFLASLGQRPIYSNQAENVVGLDITPDKIDFDFIIRNDQNSNLQQIASSIKAFILKTLN
jgi:adenylylsulfate kinase-like enzyme